MDKLSETSERVWKIIAQYPKGKATYRDIMRITGLKHSKVYEALNELKTKGFVEHEKPYWILKSPKIEEQKESFLSKVKKILSTEVALTPEIKFSKEQIAIMETIAQEYNYAWLKKFVKNLKEKI